MCLFPIPSLCFFICLSPITHLYIIDYNYFAIYICVIFVEGRKALENIHQEARDIILPVSLEDYLAKRNLSDIASTVEGVRLSSSLLTYPLTLAYVLRKIFPGQRRSLSAVVVGARAESQLPVVWWRESLVTCEKTQSLHLKFVGPESCSKILHPALKNKSMYQESLPWNMGRCDTGRELTVYSDRSLQVHTYIYIYLVY